MALALNSPEEAVLARTIDDSQADHVERALATWDLERVFEIQRCADWIQERKLTRVTLQFPDGLLKWAPSVASQLESMVGHRMAILGDTSFGDCCVDEVAAQHLNADGVIHFGDTCLTPTQRLPVLFVFTRWPFNRGSFFLAAMNVDAPRVFLFFDVRYAHAFPTKAEDTSQGRVIHCHPVEPDINDPLILCGRRCPSRPGPDDTILYCGRDLKYIQLLALTFNPCQLLQFDPEAQTLQSPTSSMKRELMQRYYLIERAKDAQRIGILVGTLGVSRYRDIIERVNQAIKASGKRSYTFLVGKPNVAKLANFPEIDLFVLIACPANSIIHSKEYMQPVITPFELDVALNRDRSWTGQFLANFQDILPGQSEHIDFEPNEEGETDISLVSGRLRQVQVAHSSSSTPETGTNNALMAQDTRVSNLHAEGGGSFLQSKSWQGLEQNLGQTEVAKAVPGLSGIAAGYAGEGEGKGDGHSP